MITNQRLTSLDGLRGLFALIIALLHFPENIISPYFIKSFLIESSFIFVDFFFLLSGFVITINYDILNYSLFKKFISKRFLRIYPLLFVLSFFMFFLIISGKFISFVFTGNFGTDFSYITHINPLFESIFLTNSCSILGYSSGIIYPSWSISAEFISYIVFAIVCLIFPKNRTYLFLVIIFVSYLFLLYLNNFFPDNDYGFARCFFGFFTGAFLQNTKFRIKINIPNIFLILSLLVSMYLINFYNSRNFSLFIGPVIYIIFGLIILNLSKNNKGHLSFFLNTAFMQLLGRISYSIYLTHTVIFHLILILIERFNLKKVLVSDISEYLFLIFVFFLIILISKVTYKYLEISLASKIKKMIK
jgi:peptidoglycan/LPS O-acetylase OafA/YrhL